MKGNRVADYFLSRLFPVDIPHVLCHTPVYNQQETDTLAANKGGILQGTLDLMVLKTLEAMGPLHGYGIARRIEQISQDTLRLNQGTIYVALLRLLHKGWIKGEWGTSENNRKAKFYSITKSGRKQLRSEAESWQQLASLMGRFLRMTEPSQG